ncbi:MAG TPA: FAD-dependent oxidoreductase, partial [Thermoleophilaceae bacterium]
MPPTTSAAESLWLDRIPPAAHAPLSAQVHVDVAVIGGGIAGVTTALLLKRAGASVAVIEAVSAGSGVTGCTTAKVSALQSTILSTIRDRHGDEAAAVYATASLAGVEQTADLAASEDVECDLERRPAFTYAADEGELDDVAEELDAARAAGLPVDSTKPDLPYPTAGAVRLDDQLQYHPVKYVRGLAAGIPGDGSHVFEDTRVLSMKH